MLGYGRSGCSWTIQAFVAHAASAALVANKPDACLSESSSKNTGCSAMQCRRQGVTKAGGPHARDVKLIVEGPQKNCCVAWIYARRAGSLGLQWYSLNIHYFC